MTRNTDHKCIDIKNQTYEQLLKRKKYPRESFNDVISRSLDADTSYQMSDKAHSALKMLMEKQHKNQSEIINGLLECSIIEKVNKK